MTFTVKHGLDTHPKTVSETPTVGQVIDDVNLRVILGYGDNVRALINGVEQPREAQVPDGCTLVLETRCNTKAAIFAMLRAFVNWLRS